MAKLLKLRRGTTSQHSSFTGAEGEVTIDTDKDVPVVHDGSTAGGHPVAAEDLANVSSSTIVGRLVQQSIPTSHIANGALPSGVTVTTANITDLTVATGDLADDAVTAAKLASNAVVNASVDASAAIAGTKISPDFGSQSIVTTGNILLNGDSTGTSNHRLTFGAASGGDLAIYHNGSENIIDIAGASQPLDIKHGSERLAQFNPNGTVGLYHDNSLKINTAGAGINVTGNIEVSGTVDGVDIAGIGVAGGVIASATTATTQSASDNSTKVATTAYVETAVSNLVDSSPAALNTLNELAAAMGDDANFSTTVTNSIGTKFSKGGGDTITGDFTIASGTTNKNINVDVSDKIKFDDNLKATFGSSDDLQIYHDGSHNYLDSVNGNIYLRVNSTENAIKCTENGNVEIAYDGSKKFETTNAGGQISGVLYADGGRFGKDNGDYLEFTTDTRADLVINGNNEFRFEADGDFHADGDVIAFSTTIASDKNLKENIEVIPNALEKVEALRGVTFDWKRDLTPSAGVIAQEVEAVLPEAVKEVTNLKDGGSHLSVNYHALTSILIESIKELSARVKELEAK